MKKLFLVLFVGLFAKAAMASGKLALQTNYHENGHVRPVLGLSVYEPIMTKNVAFNSFVGYGATENEVDETTNWVLAKGQLDVRFQPKWVASPGIFYKWLPENGAKQSVGFIKISRDLW